MMTPKEFLAFQYGIDLDGYMDEKSLIHPTFLAMVMKEYSEHVLLSKATEVNQKDPDEAIREYRLKLLEDVKLGFDLCSDHSTICLGYRNLCDRIRREKSNEKPDKFPGINPTYDPLT